ncbi:MAG: inducible mutagenesis protein A [Pseudomonadota bacterium]|nr:inducible mutagenesis protein A [Pseudomonadota bacterium]
MKRHIAQKERLAPAARPAVSLGAAELDAALPEGGLALGALHECVPEGHGDFAATLGFGLALASRVVCTRPGFVLCAFPARCGFEQGVVHAPGLTAFGLDPDRFIEVDVAKPRAMLWVMEEALGAAALAAVIGIAGRDERAYDFTASRRLALRAARSGVTALLVRPHAPEGTTTAATTRWRIAAAPGAGPPRWSATLVKSKKGMPGHRNVVEWDHETLSLRLAAALADRTPAMAYQAGSGRGGGWAAAS